MDEYKYGCNLNYAYLLPEEENIIIADDFIKNYNNNHGIKKTPPTEQEQIMLRNKLIDAYAKENGFVELKYSMARKERYFYNKEKRMIYVVYGFYGYNNTEIDCGCMDTKKKYSYIVFKPICKSKCLIDENPHIAMDPLY